MRGLRGSGPVESGRAGGEIGGGEEVEDRSLFRDVVGFERSFQYI